MKKHTKAMASIVAVLSLCKVFIPDVAAKPAAIVEDQARVTTIQAAADYLQVQADGTVSLKNEALDRIPKDQREQAFASLDALNDQINQGQVAPFVPEDGRLEATIGNDGNVEALGNCFCGSCCSQNMCCKDGWWLFCWGYGSC